MEAEAAVVSNLQVSKVEGNTSVECELSVTKPNGLVHSSFKMAGQLFFVGADIQLEQGNQQQDRSESNNEDQRAGEGATAMDGKLGHLFFRLPASVDCRQVGCNREINQIITVISGHDKYCGHPDLCPVVRVDRFFTQRVAADNMSRLSAATGWPAVQDRFFSVIRGFVNEDQTGRYHRL